MAIETEKKYRLTKVQRNGVAAILESLRADFKGLDFEENIIYGGGALDEKNAVLRIRKTDDKTILTYKKRLASEFAVKQQIEYETEIADGAEIVKIIENLGFTPRLIYEKRRRTWHFRSVEIVVDELPFGDFMEIEGSLTAIAEAEIFLEIEELPAEHETYPGLTAQFGKRNGEVIEARF